MAKNSDNRLIIKLPLLVGTERFQGFEYIGPSSLITIGRWLQDKLQANDSL